MKIIFGLLITLLLLFFAKHTLALDASPSADPVKKYSITFPIADLGGCNSLPECKTYCDDPAHSDTCIAFAKKKGFYKQPVAQDSAKDVILKAAKVELGCSSVDECKAICAKSENIDRCSTFAKKYGVGGGTRTDPSQGQILQKAQAFLGCSSYESCKAYCSNPDNKQKCSDFAKVAGLNGGEHKMGPGGCTSEESCKLYCSTHQSECGMKSPPQGGPTTTLPPNFKGPGGCDSQESCKAYCNSHPDQCGGPKSPTVTSFPQPLPINNFSPVPNSSGGAQVPPTTPSSYSGSTQVYPR